MSRRFRCSAAALVVAAGSAAALLVHPAADAAPVAGLVRTEAPEQDRVPVVGGRLVLDLGRAIDLDGESIVAAADGGAVDTDHGIALDIARGSTITYRTAHKGIDGSARFTGGIQLSKGSAEVTISALTYDITTGHITGEVGGSTIDIAGVSEPDHAEVVKEEGSSRATLLLGGQGITLSPGLLTAIDKALGTGLSTSDNDREIEGSLTLDLDLVQGNKVNTALVTALGLDAEIDSDADRSALHEMDLDVGLQLSLL